VQAVHDGGNRPSGDEARERQVPSRHTVFFGDVDMNPMVEIFQHSMRIAHLSGPRQAPMEWLFMFRRLAIKTQNIMATGRFFVSLTSLTGCGVG
jgi:hypothetical protein